MRKKKPHRAICRAEQLAREKSPETVEIRALPERYRKKGPFEKPEPETSYKLTKGEESGHAD